MKVKQENCCYKISEKEFEIFLEIDRRSGEAAIFKNERRDNFEFNDFIGKKTIEKWERTLKLLKRALEIVKKEVKK